MTTDYKSRLNFGAPLEPENTVLHGAGQDPKGFNEYCTAVGPTRQPVLYMTYVAVAYDKQTDLTGIKDLNNMRKNSNHAASCCKSV